MRFGPLSRNLASLAWPIFIDTLLMMFLGAVDTFMLSRYSDLSVAAVGIDAQFINLVLVIFQVLSLATSILCSQYIGARLRDKVVQVVGISLIATAVVGVLVSSSLFLFAHQILQMLGAGPELIGEAEVYMKIVGLTCIFQAFSLTLAAALRSADMAKYPMMVSLIINIVNIFGNYTLIFGHFGFPALGVTGAAIATATSRGIGMVVLAVILLRKHIPSFPKRLFSPFPWDELGKLLKVGIPSAGEQMSYSLSQMVVTSFILILGNEALAARTYCQNIVMFTYVIALAMAQASAIEVGHLVGMKKPRAAFCIGKRALKISIWSSTSLSFLIACLGLPILHTLTDNENIVRMCWSVMWVDIMLEHGRAINMFAVNALRSAGDIYFPVLLSIAVVWTVAVGLSYVFGITLGFGIVGMWFALLLDENIRGYVFVKRWNSMKWATKSFVR